MTVPTKQLSASLEDYLEAIFVLSQSGQVARSKNIAEHLQVARPSVTGALRVLAEKQLIHYKPYGFITLTEKGQRAAGRVARRHEALESFFCNVLGVEPEIAQQSACLAEHAIGPEITLRLTAYLEFLAAENQAGRNTSEAFRTFCQQREPIKTLKDTL
jgi:DtxR family Mn-dependent transcriptional regulator